MKISKREIKIFALGMFAFFTFQTIYDWKQVKEDVSRGFHDGYASGGNEIEKK